MALSNNQKLYIGCFAVIIVMSVVFLACVNGDFGGSDDAGGGVADDELPGETESLLFAVQAAIGAIIIGYFIGFNAGQKRAGTGKTETEQ